ncbi:ASCH domain-containing protein [Roseateles sp.]|uniref:ASCH domain-containing protein n=1 Tax=Roseateles sp. TaxID=1971397 RepID=UPI0025E9E377|nr:ASCH domain-containing protein [Roseateles sp.]MBV8034809.1 ASCH domain-containing protein [Roseateles sp.]
MGIPSRYEAFWAAAERAQVALDRHRFLEAFAFGGSEHLAATLAELVLTGAKRATASLAWVYEFEKRPQPRCGDLSIVTSWAGEPLCIIETTAVDVLPFDAVPEDFARAEGEGDGTLASWRVLHTEFFAGECARIDRVPSATMPVVCERFRVVFPPEAR